MDGICVLSSIFLFYHLPTAGNWSALTALPSGHNLHVHFLIHWGDGDRGEEQWDKGASALGAGVGVKGVGVRSGGEEESMEQRGLTVSLSSLLLHECHLRQSEIKEHYFLL